MSTDSHQGHSRTTGWREWLGLGPAGDQSPAAPVRESDPEIPRGLTQREIWLPAKRRLLAKVADFLIDHDLEILPFTLSIGYDCVTGGNPKLAQKILERSEKGLPVTLKWLEDADSMVARDATTEAVATLVSQLEQNLGEFSTTMAGVRRANGTYSDALASHVADLEDARVADDLLARLTVLTQRMLVHTQVVERDLASSDGQIGLLQTRLDQARRMANQDHLTGLPNRRAFDEILDRELATAKQTGETLCIAFCDIDHFKRVNDTHGHPAGDRVIRYVADTLGRIADARCHVARHGGEEFAILLRGTAMTDAWARLDAAREEMAEKRLVNRANDMAFGKITFSGGIANALAFESKSAALKAADEALYAAKAAGRNRIMIASEQPDPLRDAA